MLRTVFAVLIILAAACATPKVPSGGSSSTEGAMTGTEKAPARMLNQDDESRYDLVLRDIQMAVLVIQNDSDSHSLQYLYFCDQKMKIEYSGKWPLSPRISAVAPNAEVAEAALNIITDFGQIRAGCWKGADKIKAESDGKELMKKIGRLRGYANKAAPLDPEEHPHSFYLIRRLNRRH